MIKKRIKNRARSAMVAAITMSLALVIVAGIGLKSTSNIINQFESQSLPDIRVALGLAEGVAQLTALAPYVSSTNQPSLLNQQQRRLEQRFAKLFAIVTTISNEDFKINLLTRLNAIQSNSEQLIDVVEQNLFLSEELLSRHYQLKFSGQGNELYTLANNNVEFEGIDSLISAIVTPMAYQVHLIDSLLKSFEQQKPNALFDFLNFVKNNSKARSENEQRKRFLLVSMRVQSEYLSKFVNQFANTIQEQVLEQQKKAQRLISQVFWGMVLMMALLIITVITNYGINLRVLNDLTTVTDDMIRLSNGDTSKGSLLKPTKDEVGELLNAYLIFQDYTLQIQRVSSDLEEQKLLLETIFNSMNDGLSVFSADNKLLAWNKKYIELFSLSTGALYKNMQFEEVIQKISGDGDIYKDIKGNLIDIREWTVQRHMGAQHFDRYDNSGRTFEFRSQPMLKGGFITLIQDLTYRRQTELQLQHTKKMEVIGQLTSGVSHDFNNFLTSILGNLQLLEMYSDFNEREQKYLQRALKATQKGSELITKLLAFSHKKLIETESIIVDELIKDIADLLQYSVSDDIECTFNLAASKQTINVDKIQLQNALLNLMLNANGAISEKGHICISSYLIKKQHNSWVRISVSDNGIGIPYAIQHRVFDAFFTTKEIGAGTGLGLSSVHAYVQQSGGEIGIESKPNTGTTVWMEWPIEENNELIKQNTTNSLPLTSPSTLLAKTSLLEASIHSSKVLLLVEDNLQVAETMKDLISTQFNHIKHFTTADEAWAWLQLNFSELLGILSDVHLPNSMSGIELRDKVKTHYPSVNFFLYSGMPKEKIEQQFACKITRNFINKPVNYQDIVRIYSRIHNQK